MSPQSGAPPGGPESWSEADAARETLGATVLAPIPRIYTNQQAINAGYYAGRALHLADAWALLMRAGLDVHELARDRAARYTGPHLDQVPGLSDSERRALHRELITQLLETARWTGRVRAPAGLNLRSLPDTSAQVLLVLPNGAPIQVLDDPGGEWIFVAAGATAGYVYRAYVGREQPVSVTPDDVVERMARLWGRHNGIFSELAHGMGLDPAVAVAVFTAESGGSGFGTDGRMIIRFENHIFYREWGRRNPEIFNRHFRMDPQKVWMGRGHAWRPSAAERWRGFHGSQDGEWEVFLFARTLDEEAALRSISMGAPQIMGFNCRVVGFNSAREMFDSFSASEESQIAAFFRYLETKKLVEPLRRGDFLAFAKEYNGEGQAERYQQIIRRYIQLFRDEVAPHALGGEAEETVQPSGAEEPETIHARIPFPLTEEQMKGRPMAEADPELYRAWREYILRGLEKNEELYRQVLDGFMRPYRTTLVMYRILFGVGIISFLVAGVLPYLFREDPTLAIGSAAIFGGVSLTTILSFFLSRPVKALEENQSFITWLGIVYNTYWTKLASAVDPNTFQEDIDDATRKAIQEIERLVATHRGQNAPKSGTEPVLPTNGEG